ncbi:MAG: hypothetical protein GX943_03630 [Candidatus Pacebacteria bacterium]|nr:hypothetical protein [Candidatus Paceibacterota bacterium]
MSNKKKGVFPLILGALAGATAVFFSDEKNRSKAKKTFDEAKKNPEAFAKKTAKKAQKTAKKMATKAKVAGEKAMDQHKRKAAKTRAKKSLS